MCFMVAESQTEGLVLLPSLRLGRLYNELSDGKKVYLSTEGQLVCEHGELSSNISYSATGQYFLGLVPGSGTTSKYCQVRISEAYFDTSTVTCTH